jgi:VIT1/CCC1 family predicted Fe2+/Mn2+ transporter
MPYWIAAALLVVFVVNVTLGAITKSPPVSNVGEMLILFGAAIAFSVGILRSEAKDASEENSTD